jgi:hypothetical protein
MATVIQRMPMATAIPHTVGVGDLDIGRGDTGLFGHVGTGPLELAIGQSMPQLTVPDFTAGARLTRRKSDEEKP